MRGNMIGSAASRRCRRRSRSLISASSSLVMPLVCQATQMLTSLLALPIQVNLLASNWAPLEPSSGSNAVPRPGGRMRCRPWARRYRASWPAAGCRRLPCSSARWWDCRECACRVAGNDARIEVVAAADAVADIEVDVAALVEGRGVLRACDRRGEQDRRQYEDRGPATAGPIPGTHGVTPLLAFVLVVLSANTKFGVLPSPLWFSGWCFPEMEVDCWRFITH